MTEVSILGKTKPVLNILCSDGSSFYNDNDNNKNDNNTGFSRIFCAWTINHLYKEIFTKVAQWICFLP